MDRTYASGAAGSAPSAPASPSTGYPTAGNPGSGTPATKPGPWWYHMMTEELRKVITDAGITPDHTNLTQLKAALDTLYGAQGTVVSAFKNLALSATGANANVSVTADELALEDASNKYVTARTVSLTISTAASGANGLDSGTIAASTWYAVWVIRKADGTTAGLLSTSATAPTLPTGYTFKARVGWIRTDGTGNKYPLGFTQSGRNVQYKIAAGSNLTLLPQVTSGAQGTVGTTLVAVGVGNFVPATACRVRGLLHNGGTSAQVSPNSIATQPGGSGLFITLTATQINVFQFDFAMESTNLYYASPSASAEVRCLGWEDNL